MSVVCALIFFGWPGMHAAVLETNQFGQDWDVIFSEFIGCQHSWILDPRVFPQAELEFMRFSAVSCHLSPMPPSFKERPGISIDCMLGLVWWISDAHLELQGTSYMEVCHRFSKYPQICCELFSTDAPTSNLCIMRAAFLPETCTYATTSLPDVFKSTLYGSHLTHALLLRQKGFFAGTPHRFFYTHSNTLVLFYFEYL